MASSNRKRTVRREVKRQDLANRLAYFPMLRILLHEPLFRVGLGGFVLVITTVLLMLPKVWRTTPDGFTPVVRVSGLDRLQAWSLRRGAREMMAAGRHDRAAFAWQSAVANDVADLRSLRGVFQNELASDRRETNYLSSLVSQGFWLLRIAETNRNDVSMVVDTLSKYHLTGLKLNILQPLAGHLTPALEGVRLKALFDHGHQTEFGTEYARLRDGLQGVPDLDLYHAAHLAAWGPEHRGAEGKSRLTAAMSDPNPDRAITAHRLRLAVAVEEGDLESYESSLNALSASGQDRLLDEVIYWRLLADNARADIARSRVAEHSDPPNSAGVARIMGETLLGLGMRDEARDLLFQSAQRFSQDTELWALLAGVLTEDRDWDALRSVALAMRRANYSRRSMVGLSRFYEGRAHLGAGRLGSAEKEFERALEYEPPSPSLGMMMAREWTRLGLPRFAGRVLEKLEAAFSTDPEYWHAVCLAAHRRRDAKTLAIASERAYALDPDNPVHASNHAAALLILREQPATAIRLTLQLIHTYPRSTTTRINHASALLLSRRTDEAAAILRDIDTQSLDAEAMSAYNLALYEIHLNRNDRAGADKIVRRIDRGHLFPPQLNWLDASLGTPMVSANR